jgi:UDP-glucuronate decarboxylase
VRGNSILAEDLQYTLDRCSADGAFRRSTVLITGCAGFLGFYFLHFFTRFARTLSVRKIIGLDNFKLTRPTWIAQLADEHRDVLTVHTFDIATDDLPGALEGERIDYILHLASVASPTFYRKYPLETLDANIWGLRRLLDYSRERSVKGVLFFSSSEVYGNPPPEHIPTDEDFPGRVATIGPRACYDEAKRFGETLCYVFATRYGVPVTIVRPFNNYGPGMRLADGRVPADFARAVHEDRDIEILSDGTPTRTFCYIADAAAGYIKALTFGRFECFNIGMEAPEISVRKLAEIYAEKGRKTRGYTGKVRFAAPTEDDYLTHNPARRCPRIEKARRLLGFRPSIDVDEGVERSLEFIRIQGGDP